MRRPSPNVAAVAVLVLLGAALLLWQRPWASQGVAVPQIPADAPALLTEQLRVMSAAPDADAFADAAGGTADARRFATQVWAAREQLGARDVSLRYLSGGEVADADDGSTTVDVEVTWTPADTAVVDETGEQHATVRLRALPLEGDRFAIVDAAAGDGPLPLWLAGEVGVSRADDVVLVRVDGGDPDLPLDEMSAAAHDAVRRIVPGSRGDLVVVSAASQGQMAQLVGRTSDDVRRIAAVTTRLDGRSGTATDTVVVLNPAVFSTMDRRAAQVVLTHEATHLMTDAAGTSVETWVAEGFADFVALHDDDAPLAVSAGQVLAQVRSGDLPGTLPTADDFAAAGHGLGAVYESAWMVFRMLGETHDDATIVAFYRAVRDGADVDDALWRSFGLDERELTARWRDYLTKSASTVS